MKLPLRVRIVSKTNKLPYALEYLRAWLMHFDVSIKKPRRDAGGVPWSWNGIVALSFEIWKILRDTVENST